jgi:hypothetical protein
MCKENIRRNNYKALVATKILHVILWNWGIKSKTKLLIPYSVFENMTFGARFYVLYWREKAQLK